MRALSLSLLSITTFALVSVTPAQDLQSGFNNLQQNYGSLCQQSQGMATGCGGAGASAPARTTVPTGPTPQQLAQQQLAMVMAQMGGQMLGQGIHQLLFGQTPKPAMPLDPATQQRLLAAQQYNNSGIFLLKNNNFSGAVNEFQKALQQSPGDANILANLKLAQQMQSNSKQAGANSNELSHILGKPTQPQSSNAPANFANPFRSVNLDPNNISFDGLQHESLNAIPVNSNGTTDLNMLKGQIDNVFGKPASTPPTTGADQIDKILQPSATTPTATSPAPPPDPDALMKKIFDLNDKSK